MKPKETIEIDDRKALIYARVSTKGQDPRAQIHRCTDYCISKNIQVERVFEDKFTGGGDFMERPAMKELIGYLDKHPHKKYIVVFDDLKRMARDTEFHLRLRREFDARDVLPLSPNYKFGNTPEDRFMEIVNAAQGEIERLQNKRQVIQKMKARLERGYWAFGSPRGYTQEKDAIHGKLLTPKEPEFSLIKEALEGFAFGRFDSQEDACKFLERNNFNGKGKRVYSTKFKESLCNRILYAGYIEYPDWDVKRMKGHHKAAISLEVFEMIQEKLKRNANVYFRDNVLEDFPLRGFVECTSCNRKLTASWSSSRGKHYGYYHCRIKDCAYYGKSIPFKRLHNDFESILKRLTPDEGTIETFRNFFHKSWFKKLKGHEIQKENWTREIEESEEAIMKYLEMAKNTINEEIRKRYEESADNLIQKQQLLKEKLTEKPKDMDRVGNALEKVIAYLKNPYGIWVNENLKVKKQLLKLIFKDNIQYDKKNGVGNVILFGYVNCINGLSKGLLKSSPYVDMGGETWKHACDEIVLKEKVLESSIEYRK